MSAQADRRCRSRSLVGFTLVELLVVIGIIAILISIILPTLSSARRTANAVKCAAEMKEIWNAYLMYAGEFHDCFPVAKWGGPYSLGNTNYPYTFNNNGTNYTIYPYWQDFLGRYLTKLKVGGAASTADEQAAARKTVLWGCPAWDAYQNGSVMVHSGYGMNASPSYTPTYPAGNGEPSGNGEWAIGPVAGVNGGFLKRGKWTRSGERCLIADGLFWLVESLGLPAGADFPPQPTMDNTGTFTTGVNGQTTVDVHRHGKYPPRNTTPAGTFAAKGGMIGYNMLYADGHCERCTTQDQAYRAIRMRFPG